MTKLAIIFALAAVTSLSAAPAFAHGDAPHPKCKKGYVLNDDHKCVKAGS